MSGCPPTCCSAWVQGVSMRQSEWTRPTGRSLCARNWFLFLTGRRGGGAVQEARWTSPLKMFCCLFDQREVKQNIYSASYMHVPLSRTQEWLWPSQCPPEVHSLLGETDRTIDRYNPGWQGARGKGPASRACGLCNRIGSALRRVLVWLAVLLLTILKLLIWGASHFILNWALQIMEAFLHLRCASCRFWWW